MVCGFKDDVQIRDIVGRRVSVAFLVDLEGEIVFERWIYLLAASASYLE